MIERHFKFKVAENLFFDMLDECYIDIIYSAEQNEENEDEYIVSWTDPETKEIDSLEYYREVVEGALAEGSWILVHEDAATLIEKTL